MQADLRQLQRAPQELKEAVNARFYSKYFFPSPFTDARAQRTALQGETRT
jgi:hypothetical protein